MRIALFVTCLTDTLFPATGRAVVTLLERLGHRVEFPDGQTCCGQMHFNSGYRRESLPMARGFAEAFAEFDVIVSPSASCTAMVSEYHGQLAAEAGDAALARTVAGLAPRVYDLSTLLVDVLGVTDVGAYFPHRVTYHPTCHSLRMLRVGDAPLRLLREVRGLELAELPAAESCCGFGGTFSIKNPDVSAAMCADATTSWPCSPSVPPTTAPSSSASPRTASPPLSPALSPAARTPSSGTGAAFRSIRGKPPRLGIVVPDGVPEEWVEGLPGSIVLVRDEPPLSAAQLDEVAGVVTGCAVAIADRHDRAGPRSRPGPPRADPRTGLPSGYRPAARWRPTCRTLSGGWTRADRRP